MKVGQRVDRIENRESTKATIIAVDGENYLLSYDEGGEGWWDEDSIVALPLNEGDD